MARKQTQSRRFRAKRQLRLERLEDRRLGGVNLVSMIAAVVAIGSVLQSLSSVYVADAEYRSLLPSNDGQETTSAIDWNLPDLDITAAARASDSSVVGLASPDSVAGAHVNDR